MNIWLAGPSGAGKSYIADRLRERKLCRTFDLDFVGYRINQSDWKEWNIPPAIFGVLHVPNQPIVAVGCDSHYPVLLKAAVKVGFIPLILLPDSDTIAVRRSARRDTAEKIAAAKSDADSWAKKADDYHIQIVQTLEEVESYLAGTKIPTFVPTR